MNEVLTRKINCRLILQRKRMLQKESGAHGKDTRGISAHISLTILNSSFSARLKTPGKCMRIAANCEGNLQKHECLITWSMCALHNAPSQQRRYDFEAWMPAQGAYREVISCSNCTDTNSPTKHPYRKKKVQPPNGVTHHPKQHRLSHRKNIVRFGE